MSDDEKISIKGQDISVVLQGLDGSGGASGLGKTMMDRHMKGEETIEIK
jgi:hypothetical protein